MRAKILIRLRTFARMYLKTGIFSTRSGVWCRTHGRVVPIRFDTIVRDPSFNERYASFCSRPSFNDLVRSSLAKGCLDEVFQFVTVIELESASTFTWGRFAVTLSLNQFWGGAHHDHALGNILFSILHNKQEMITSFLMTLLYCFHGQQKILFGLLLVDLEDCGVTVFGACIRSFVLQ